METNLTLEKYPGLISTVTIGSEGEELTAGGQNALPLLFKEGNIPNPPKIAFEVWDIFPGDFDPELLNIYGEEAKDPFAWAELGINKCKADLICLRLQGAHPDYGDKNASKIAGFVEKFLCRIKVPLVIIGSGDDIKDNLIMPACSEAARGRRCLLGSAVQDNYKTLVASALADGHNIIAESPIDVNIAKQLNILISDMGLPLERIVIDPTIGALGYGLEYAYSIMERARLAALSGDRTLASPFICMAGQEAWKSKEAKEIPGQGAIWEALTATSLIQAGADILVMRHPKAIEETKNHINILFGGK